MADIFISYNREDQPLALIYKQAFESAGLDVWWDQTLRSGEAYDEVTEAALRAAKAVVVLWSGRSVLSRWVRAEATIADRNKTLVPVMVEACERPIMFELVQTADLIGWNGESEDLAWRAFLSDVRHFIDGSHPQQAGNFAAPSSGDLPDKPSIAVLPFANMSGDPEQAYFVDGLMEEIVTSLTRIKSLFVIASGSSLALKGKDLTPSEAARRLGVRYVVEGSVRRSGDQVRVSVKLIDAVNGVQIRAERFDGKMDDIFDLQEKVALAVAGAIEYAVQGAELLLTKKRAPEDLRSYDLRLQAVTRLRSYRKEDVYAALDMLDRAIALDPDNGLALSLAAGCHALIAQFHWSDDLAAHGQAMMELTGRSLKADPDNAEVLTTAAINCWTTGDLPGGKRLVDRAADLNPGSSWTHTVRGLIAVATGNLDLAEESLLYSLKLDPISPNRNLQIGGLAATRFAQRRFPEAAELCREYVQLSHQPMSHSLRAATYGHMGEAVAAADTLAILRDLTTTSVEELAHMHFGTPEHRDLFLEGISLAEAALQAA